MINPLPSAGIYIQAINRELTLRASTYPKMLEKQKKVLGQQEVETMAVQMRRQTELLVFASSMFIIHESREPQHTAFNPQVIEETFRELQRELRLRKQLYPRWARWGLITSETACLELSVWMQLTEDFHKQFCPKAPWRKPAVRKAKTPQT